jgi:hypothetical protein
MNKETSLVKLARALGELDKKKKVGVGGLAVLVPLIIAGFTSYSEQLTRIALIEDDLTETIEIVSTLHPPSPTPRVYSVHAESEQSQEDKAKRRRDLLDKLRQRKPKKKSPDAGVKSTDSGV